MQANHETSKLIAPFAALAALALAGTGLLWWHYGERVFIERLLAGIAGCF
ncbi:hypothetical protein H2509_04240 [Stappia sp. F7233]|uniref:Uncharacterized protein n=1 Tax=Stappia albiluteola TaxID=2758565 RepID=A0A839ABK5_9HYPH|nr:hypothetical protein [Stappia albiluteola]MBA5776332.1 hypothetical protein [Stappia albiluteola]